MISFLATATPIETAAPPLLVKLREIASAPEKALIVALSVALTNSAPVEVTTVLGPMILAWSVFAMVLIETAPAPARTNPDPDPNPAVPPPAMVTESMVAVDETLTSTSGADTVAPLEISASMVF